jgi:DNA-binding transcriptional regulator YhcF (GntR family)
MVDQFTEDVKALQEKGLSQRKIADELKVSRNKVQGAIQKLKQAEIVAALLPEDKMRSIIREELKAAHDAEEEETKEKEKLNGQFPVVRKMGGGMEAIAPEAVLKQYMGGSTPEEQLELRAIMKFRAAMLMVMDLVDIQKGSAEADAKRLMPILALMKETREEQDAAAARARASSEEIADRAAHETAGSLLGALSQNNAQVSGSLEQIRQMLSGKSDDPFSRLLNMMQSMQQMAQMFGMPMPGMVPGAPGGQGAFQPPVEPQPIEKHSINELEG